MHNHDIIAPPPQRGFKDFLPLLVIFAAILVFTGFMYFRAENHDAMYAMRIFMGAFFVGFGGFKVIRWKGVVNAYRIYDLIAMRSRGYAYAYPLIELALGAAYLLSFQLLITSWVTLILMLAGSAGVAKKLLEKEFVPCACLGTVFKLPMTKVTLFEDLLMAVMSLGVIIYTS